VTFRHYIFDFDGVLFDTARECLSLAFEAATSNATRWTFARTWQGLDTAPRDVEELFLKQRYWVGPPWQYSVLLKVISEGNLPRTTKDFLDLSEDLRAQHEPFTEEYFAARKRQASDQQKWLRNMRPVAQSCQVFQALGNDSTWILSTRDGDSIRRIYESLLGKELPASRLLPRAGAKEKWELLLDFAREHDVPAESIFFLDDYVAHALPAHRHGFSSYLASWGYLGPDDLKEASVNGLPVLRLEELEEKLKDEFAAQSMNAEGEQSWSQH
jgi:phosphoglycolate phosphatase-like HAD superfamily hydrolase